MNNDILTFEWNQESEKLEIHCDHLGMKRLIGYLERLLSVSGNEHSHLMTSEWGGNELGSEQQNERSVLINHVKICKWE